MGVMVMNKVILMGRLTKDAELRNARDESKQTMAKITLAVEDKGWKDENDNYHVDYISGYTLGKLAEILGKCSKGQRIVVVGKWRTGSYESEGKKVYTNQLFISEMYYADVKKGNVVPDDVFMNLPEIPDEELPFK